jgi:hypothetical protein
MTGLSKRCKDIGRDSRVIQSVSKGFIQDGFETHLIIPLSLAGCLSDSTRVVKAASKSGRSPVPVLEEDIEGNDGSRLPKTSIRGDVAERKVWWR